MKRITSILLIAAMLLCLAACDDAPETGDDSVTTSAAEETSGTAVTDFPPLDIELISTAREQLLNFTENFSYVEIDGYKYYKLANYATKQQYLNDMSKYYDEECVSRIEPYEKDGGVYVYADISLVRPYLYAQAREINFDHYDEELDLLCYWLLDVPIENSNEVQDFNVLIKKSSGKIVGFSADDINDRFGNNT